MNKHVNKVRKATGRAETITAGRQQNKQQYLIIQLMKKKESIKTGQKRQQSHYTEIKRYHVAYLHTTIILTYWYIGRPINVINFDNNFIY